MFQRQTYTLLRNRLAEPRRFIQVFHLVPTLLRGNADLTLCVTNESSSGDRAEDTAKMKNSNHWLEKLAGARISLL